MADFQPTNKTVTNKDVQKCHDVYYGTDNISKYLTKQTGESSEAFKARQDNAKVTQSFFSGVDSIVKIIFRKKIEFVNFDDARIEQINKSTDYHSFNEFAQLLLLEALLSNTVYCLVWNEKRDNKLTKAEKEALQLFPKVTMLKRDEVYEHIENGKLKYIQVHGKYTFKEGRYKDELKDEFVLYFPNGEVERWRDSGEGIKLVEETNNNLGKINIVKLTLNKKVDKPLFADESKYALDYSNIQSSKVAYALKLGFPLVVTHGLFQNADDTVAEESTDDKGNRVVKVEFQSNAGINFPVNADGKHLGDLKIVEISGNASKVLSEDLKEIDDEILKGFVKFLNDNTGNKTVEQSESERAIGESKLSTIAGTLEDALNVILELWQDYEGISGGDIEVNREYIKQGLTDQQAKNIIDLNMQGKLTDRTLLENLANGDYVKVDDIDEEIKLIEAKTDTKEL